MFVLFVLIGPGWLLIRLLGCQSFPPLDMWCEWSFTIPLLLLVSTLGIYIIALWGLMDFGIESKIRANVSSNKDRPLDTISHEKLKEFITQAQSRDEHSFDAHIAQHKRQLKRQMTRWRTHTRSGYERIGEIHQLHVRTMGRITCALIGTEIGYGVFYYTDFPALAAFSVAIISATALWLLALFKISADNDGGTSIDLPPLPRPPQPPSGIEQVPVEVFRDELVEIDTRRKKVLQTRIAFFPELIDALHKADASYQEQEKKKKELQLQEGTYRNLIKKFEYTFLKHNPAIKQIEEEIRKHRKKSEETREQLTAAIGRPSTKYGLVGLALSGGGIRSAAFNLGTLQALAQNRMLRYVDYLSTVSGGGYIGSALSCLLINEKFDTDRNFPFRVDEDGHESLPTIHIRNSSNYLAPGGIRDFLRIPAELLRGILLNFFLIFPYIAASALLTAATIKYIPGSLKSEAFIPVLIGLVFWLFLVVIYPLIAQVYSNWNRRDSLGRLYTITFAFIPLAFVVCTLPTLAELYRMNFDKILTELLQSQLITNSVPSLADDSNIPYVKAFLLLVALLPLAAAKVAVRHLRTLKGKFAVFMLGILGPLILFFGYLEITKQLYEKGPIAVGILMAAVFVAFLLRIVLDINRTSMHDFYRDRLSKAFLLELNENGTVAHSKQSDEQKLQNLSPCGPYHLIVTALNLTGSKDPNLRGRNADYFILSKKYCGSSRTTYIETSKLENDYDRHMNLGTAMAISGAAAAANMGSTTVKSLVFLLTLLNIRLGYWAPNPKRFHESSPIGNTIIGIPFYYFFSELMGRLNENDRYVNLSDGGHIENIGLYPLLDRRCKFIIACDAERDGNYEFGSLGIALRYAKISFNINVKWQPGLTLDDIRPDKSGFSKRNFAAAQIIYPNDDEAGWLLYIKSSLTTDVSTHVRAYRDAAKHDRQGNDFPHESTTDQFFSEGQFEAYRQLGYEIVDKIFGASSISNLVGDDRSPSTALREVFDDIVKMNAPAPQTTIPPDRDSGGA